MLKRFLGLIEGFSTTAFSSCSCSSIVKGIVVFLETSSIINNYACDMLEIHMTNIGVKSIHPVFFEWDTMATSIMPPQRVHDIQINNVDNFNPRRTVANFWVTVSTPQGLYILWFFIAEFFVVYYPHWMKAVWSKWQILVTFFLYGFNRTIWNRSTLQQSKIIVDTWEIPCIISPHIYSGVLARTQHIATTRHQISYRWLI